MESEIAEYEDNEEEEQHGIDLPSEDNWEQADVIRQTMRSYIDTLVMTLSMLKTTIREFDKQFSPQNCLDADLEKPAENPMYADQQI